MSNEGGKTSSGRNVLGANLRNVLEGETSRGRNSKGRNVRLHNFRRLSALQFNSINSYIRVGLVRAYARISPWD